MQETYPFLLPEIEKYCEEHSSAGHPFLQHIARMTNLKLVRPQMMSGHWQGMFLTMICRMLQPQRILEIGTFSGYATVCLAEGLTENGIIHTIEKEVSLEDFLDDIFNHYDLKHKIRLHFGDALNIIPSFDETFDLVFIDADKVNYEAYYHLAIEKVRPGGIIIADNVLWYGKVIEYEKSIADKETESLKRFNDLVQNDNRVENVMIPIRDGLLMVCKK